MNASDNLRHYSMRYVIFADHEGIEGQLFSTPVGCLEAAFLREAILPKMRLLSDEEYVNGPAAILHTAARFSYVLDGRDVYWCVEWDPGLLVIRFSPDGGIAWAAARSPNPEFGGRSASDEELEAYDEDAPNPQYNLVFDAWDAQFEDEERENWHPAESAERAAFEAASAHVNALHAELDERNKDKGVRDRWLERCERSPIWRGSESTV